MDTVVQEWNVHRISRSRNSASPTGRPIIMFSAPQIYEARDYKREVSLERLVACKEECVVLNFPCDEDVYNLCNIILEEQNLFLTGDPYQAVDVYISLRNEIKRLLED